MGETDLRAALLRLHRPDYTVNGTLYEHVVMVTGDDVPEGHVCRVGVDSCIPPDEHYVPACSECRVFGDDGDVTYYALWPCPTAMLARSQT